MTANVSHNLLYFTTGLIVIARTYQLVRFDWSRPLKHGPGFFLTSEVAPGFYDEAGRRWLARYRAVVIAEYAIEWIALVAIVIADRGQWLPIWAGGSALLYLSSMGLFGLVASRTLYSAETQRAVALSLDARRLRDFLSWRVEVPILATLAAGWALILTEGDAAVRWGVPAILTYVVLALFAAKVVHIKAGAPLPVDRTDEHQRYFHAVRRQALQVIDCMRWFFVFVFAGYVVLHGGTAGQRLIWLRWALIIASVAIWLAMVVTIIVGTRRLDAMGRDLRPSASWAGPFRASSSALRGGGLWAVSFVVGLALLFAIFGM